MLGYSLCDSMDQPLVFEGDDEFVGSKCIIKRAEVVRVITEALHSLGYSKSGACLVEESGIPLHSPSVDLFMHQILEGQWDESVSMLHKIGLVDEGMIKSASFVIFEQKFLELLDDGKVMDALKTLRVKMTPLCVHNERIKELASFVVSPSQNLVDNEGSKIESRRRFVGKLRKLFPPNVMVPEERLLHLVEQALALEKEGCKFHNSSVGKMALLDDHHCGGDHVPTKKLQSQDVNIGQLTQMQVLVSSRGQYFLNSKEGLFHLPNPELTRVADLQDTSKLTNAEVHLDLLRSYLARMAPHTCQRVEEDTEEQQRDWYQHMAAMRSAMEINEVIMSHLRADQDEILAGQAQLRAELAQVRAQQAQMEAQQAQMRANQDEMRADLAQVRSQQAQMRANLDEILAEQAQLRSELAQVRAQQAQMEAQQAQILETLRLQHHPPEPPFIPHHQRPPP